MPLRKIEATVSDFEGLLALLRKELQLSANLDIVLTNAADPTDRRLQVCQYQESTAQSSCAFTMGGRI